MVFQQGGIIDEAGVVPADRVVEKGIDQDDQKGKQIETQDPQEAGEEKEYGAELSRGRALPVSGLHHPRSAR